MSFFARVLVHGSDTLAGRTENAKWLSSGPVLLEHQPPQMHVGRGEEGWLPKPNQGSIVKGRWLILGSVTTNFRKLKFSLHRCGNSKSRILGKLYKIILLESCRIGFDPIHACDKTKKKKKKSGHFPGRPEYQGCSQQRFVNAQVQGC